MIVYPNHVWFTNVNYIPMYGGFPVLVAILNWYSRYLLSWKLSTTLDRRSCIEALHEAVEIYGYPEIFNADQECQYTSGAFIGILKATQIKISMGMGKAGPWTMYLSSGCGEL